MSTNKIRARVVLVHFRKAGVAHGLPWTVHYRGACIPASTVKFEVPSETIFKPTKKSNPRAWMRALGVVTIFTETFENKSPAVHVTISREY